jgi:hypothetical protein
MTINKSVRIEKSSKTIKTKIIVKSCYSNEKSITEAFMEVMIRHLKRKKS